jgi:hypothetical protein
LFSDYYAHAYDVSSLVNAAIDEKGDYHPYPYFILDECRRCLALWIKYANETIHHMQTVFKAAQIDDKYWTGEVVKIQKLADDYTIEMAYDLRKEAETS